MVFVKGKKIKKRAHEDEKDKAKEQFKDHYINFEASGDR